MSVALLASLFTLAPSQVTDTVTGDPPAVELENAGEQVLRGAGFFARNCAVCHGKSAAGFAEAKLAFPREDRHCTRCHRPSNPTKIDWKNIQDHNMFSLGSPPALRGEGALTNFPSAEAVYLFIRRTMPRYEPGRLSDEEYLDITAFLLQLNNALPRDLTLAEENAAGVLLDNR